MAVWIDVRTPEEFATGHCKGAINVPHQDIMTEIGSICEDREAPIHLYCRSGHRSEWAKDVLQGMGYANAVNEGGLEDLSARGLL